MRAHGGLVRAAAEMMDVSQERGWEDGEGMRWMLTVIL